MEQAEFDALQRRFEIACGWRLNRSDPDNRPDLEEAARRYFGAARTDLAAEFALLSVEERAAEIDAVMSLSDVDGIAEILSMRQSSRLDQLNAIAALDTLAGRMRDAWIESRIDDHAARMALAVAESAAESAHE